MFKELDETTGTEEVRVLGSDLDDDLEILTEVGGQHLTETDVALIDAETAKEGDKPFGVQFDGPNNDAFDI